MQNLLLEEGGLVNVEYVQLPVATFVEFKPKSIDFLDITNPKAVLESEFRGFACLTAGDVIAINYNHKIYELCVLKVRPCSPASIIECDLNVEFAPPDGYKKRKLMDGQKKPEELIPESSGLVAFRGQSIKLNGDEKRDEAVPDSFYSKPVNVRGIPDYDFKLGSIKFFRHIKQTSINKEVTDYSFFHPYKKSHFHDSCLKISSSRTLLRTKRCHVSAKLR